MVDDTQKNQKIRKNPITEEPRKSQRTSSISERGVDKKTKFKIVKSTKKRIKNKQV